LSTKQPSGHAIVLGASVSGLLAARVLSESFEKVTIFDRDDLPAGAVDRKGTPQGEHSHGLLARGGQVFEDLFPGFTADLTARGGLRLDLQADGIWINDGRRIVRTESGLLGLCVSRAMLEWYVRTRVAAIANVTIKDRHEALGLLTDDDATAVNGVRVLPSGGTPESLRADLVVDATGRGNRGPTWLAEIGYDKPTEDLVDTATVYMSRNYRRTPGDVDFAAIVMSPSPAAPYGGVALAAEDDRWMVTLLGVGEGQAPPSDPEGYLEFTRKLPGQELYELLRRSEPLDAPRKMRLPTSVRRRYEHMTRLPEGFIAFGDAICSFNPAYGQGMTVAAAEASVLQACLSAGRTRLPRRFFAGAAKVIDVPWDIAVGADLRYPAVVGARSGKTKFLNAYVGKVHVAAERHAVVGHRFLSVANLMMPPQKLFAPGIVARVLWSGRRAGKPVDAQLPMSPVRPAEPDERLEPVR
jgi:2-polyprenyl-6-methoxyphenol hydroxylase-like FAD-dependent oxidoreductase